MNKRRFFILLIAVIVLFLSVLSINVFAANFSDPLQDFTGNPTGEAAGKVNTALSKSLGVIQLISLGTAFIMLIVLAIKYMISSVSDRAEIKKHAVIYVLGAVLMFGAGGIVQIIKNFADEKIK